MNVDRLLAILALLGMAIFLMVPVYYVRRVDLGAVVVIVILLATYDFYRELTRRAR